MTDYYKAVRLDHTSHYDEKTKWSAGRIVRLSECDPASIGPCGKGLHCSPTLLDAVKYQQGSSDYCIVRPLDIIAQDETKSRSSAIKVIRWIPKEEIDALAGFKLWEANHPFNPLLSPIDESIDLKMLVKHWASVRASVRASVEDSVRASVWASVRASVWASVGASVGASVWASVRASVRASVEDSVWASVGASVGASVWASVRASVGASVWASVRASVWDSVEAYQGGLFPNIKRWQYAESLGTDPWRPLLTLWYGGYIPSFDGMTWRLHAGKDAKIIASWTKEELGL